MTAQREIQGSPWAFSPPTSQELEFQCLRRRHWNELRVEWKFSLDRGRVYFHSFANQSEVKGAGRVALQQVCDLADQQGIEMELWTIFPKLFDYYKYFGFEARPYDPVQTNAVWFVRKAQS